jgi:hypothetical protein
MEKSIFAGVCPPSPQNNVKYIMKMTSQRINRGDARLKIRSSDGRSISAWDKPIWRATRPIRRNKK